MSTGQGLSGPVAPGPGGAPTLRPLSAGETLDAALKLYTRNAPSLWLIVAAVVVPLEALWVIVSRLVLGNAYQVNGTLGKGLQTTSGRATVINILLEVIILLGTLLSTGAVFKYLLDAYLSRRPTVDSSFGFALARHRVFSLLWVAILAEVLTLVGFVLLILPGIWVLVSVSVAVPVLLLEALKGTRAIRRSFQLVSGRWWATFGRFLLALVLYVVVYVVTQAIGGAIANSVSSPLVWLIVRAIFFAIGAILFAPFWAAVINVIYVDLRVRKEGLATESLAAQLDAQNTPRASSGTGLPGDTTPPPPPAIS